MLQPIQERVELEPVVDNLPSAIIVVNRDRKVLLANRMAMMFANRTKEEFHGLYGGEAFRCVNSKMAPEGCGFASACRFCQVKSAVQETFETRVGKIGLEATMTFFDLGTRFLKVSTTYMEIGDREVVILAMDDISDLKQQERLRLENEKLRAAVETAGAVCHEMNQPLMVLSGRIDLLMMGNAGMFSLPSSLEAMRAQVDRMAEITRKLMRLRDFKTRDYLNVKILDLDTSSAEDNCPPRAV